MQEIPIVQEFVTMDLCPRFDEPLLCAWQSAPDALNRIESNTASNSWYAAWKCGR
jgi:hypothetical protein